jgi:hypothetical protein
MLKRIILLTLIFLVGIESVHAAADTLVPTKQVLTEAEHIEQQKLIYFENLDEQKCLEHCAPVYVSELENFTHGVGAVAGGAGALVLTIVAYFELTMGNTEEALKCLAGSIAGASVAYFLMQRLQAKIDALMNGALRKPLSNARDDVIRFYSECPEQLPATKKEKLEPLIMYYKIFNTIPFGSSFKEKALKAAFAFKAIQEMLAYA